MGNGTGIEMEEEGMGLGRTNRRKGKSVKIYRPFKRT
jgi:hypothetical protein